MTTLEFLKEKNKLVKDVTGLILTPKDQLVDIPKVQLHTFKDSTETLSREICPYCTAFYCCDCPISKANNECGYKDSTWKVANEAWKIKATKADHNKLMQLVDKYNQQ